MVRIVKMSDRNLTSEPVDGNAVDVDGATVMDRTPLSCNQLADNRDSLDLSTVQPNLTL